jgi:hypothetical protein
MKIVGIEVTQAIQCFNADKISDVYNNKLRLAQGKWTLVRVYIDSDETDTIPCPDIKLTVNDGESDVMLCPLKKSITGNHPTNKNRNDLNKTLNFKFFPDIADKERDLTFSASVNSDSSTELKITKKFYPMKKLKLVRVFGTDKLAATTEG